MVDKIDEVLSEVKELKHWLYGKNGFEGDIPEIKACYKDHSKRIRRIELTLVALGLLGTGVLGVFRLLN